MSTKKQPIRTVKPFLIKGISPFSTINPFADSTSNIPVLTIDSEGHFSEEKEADQEGVEG